mmetsp:Transcript_15942/g.28693  ORF Transcript_15942/g.28693 Transcript_15942/m.28693 type:complete len:106 (+) Transcript_15942:264-581(+)
MFRLRAFVCFVLLLALFCVDAAVTKAKILADREKRARMIEQSLKVVQKQIDDHMNGVKTLPDGRLASLKSRAAKYESEIASFTKPLSDKEIDELIKMEQEKGDEL